MAPVTDPDSAAVRSRAGMVEAEAIAASSQRFHRAVGREDLLVGAMILVGIAVRLWAALQWPVNFDSDEAIFGLMAKHLLRGRYTATVYGTEHLGSLESILAAPFLVLFGDSPFIFRLPAVGLFGLFLIAHGYLVRRMFGSRIAALSLVPLAIPGFQMLAWTYQPIGAYHLLLLLGTLLLVVGWPLLASESLPAWRWFLFGLVVGLGFWSNQMIIVYLLAIGIVALLRSEVWASLRDQIGNWWGRVVQIPFEQAMPVAVIGLAMVGLLAFFSGGCDPVWRFAKVQTGGRLTLLAIGAAVAGSLLSVSRSKSRWLLGAGAMAIGAIIGYSPQWLPWLFAREAPAPVLWASCPTDVFSHVELVLKQLLPAMWGLPLWETFVGMGPLAILAWALVASAIVAGLASALWRYRIDLWDALTLKPMASASGEIALWSALFLGPLALSALASNTVDLHSVRHLLVSWQAGGVLLALTAGWLAGRWGRWVLVLAGILLAAVGVLNLATASNRWLVKFTTYRPEQVTSLRDRLVAEGVGAAYADFWGAFTLSYLLDEEVIVAPHNGINRIPSYSERAGTSDPVAVIQPRAWAQESGDDMAGLLNSLSVGNPISGEGAARQEVRDRLERGSLRSKSHVESWTLWIVDFP